MGVVFTESWTPTVAAPTISYNVGAGVTPRIGLQVTNNTIAELLILDSAEPPLDKAQAKYVVPPRCTATYPLDSAVMAARWLGPIDAVESVEFVFTDEPTQPQVWPGIIPTGGTTSPVQSAIANRFNIGSWPLVLNTDSGLNIGQVYVYNNTSLKWYVQTSTGGFKRIFIQPRSWVTLPMNQLSGSVDVNTIGSLINGLYQNDAFYVAWSDINYLTPFPSGGSSLPNPITNPEAARVGELPSQQFSYTGEVNAPGVGVLGSLGTNVGAVQRIVITHINMEVSAGAAGPALGIVMLSRGFDGLGGNVRLLSVRCDTNENMAQQRSGAPIVVSNLSGATLNEIQLHSNGNVVNNNALVTGYILT